MVEIAATKRTTLYGMLEGSTLETALTAARRESDGDFTVADLTMEHRPALSGVPHPPGRSTVNVGDSLGLIGAEGITVWHTRSALENTHLDQGPMSPEPRGRAVGPRLVRAAAF